EPSLSIVCFRYAPPALREDAEALDRLNKQILEAVQLGGNAFCSSTTVRGAFCLRACVINHRSTEADVDLLVRHVEQAAARLSPYDPPPAIRHVPCRRPSRAGSGRVGKSIP